MAAVTAGRDRLKKRREALYNAAEMKDNGEVCVQCPTDLKTGRFNDEVSG